VYGYAYVHACICNIILNSRHDDSDHSLPLSLYTSNPICVMRLCMRLCTQYTVTFVCVGTRDPSISVCMHTLYSGGISVLCNLCRYVVGICYAAAATAMPLLCGCCCCCCYCYAAVLLLICCCAAMLLFLGYYYYAARLLQYCCNTAAASSVIRAAMP
jgi:hypothetical protein